MIWRLVTLAQRTLIDVYALKVHFQYGHSSISKKAVKDWLGSGEDN